MDDNGARVGADGVTVGQRVGLTDGGGVGENDGLLGKNVGSSVGVWLMEGRDVGCAVGTALGWLLGRLLGSVVGWCKGAWPETAWGVVWVKRRGVGYG